MSVIDWAFSQDVSQSEKLVLVYLATRSNTAGIGLLDREELARLCGYKTRSVQRLLKELKDGGRIHVEDPWVYLQTGAPFVAVGGAALVVPDAAAAPALAIDADEIGEKIAQHILEAADVHLDALTALLGRFDLAGPPTAEPEPEPEPPPDPVLETEYYQDMIEVGVPESAAYRIASRVLGVTLKVVEPLPVHVASANSPSPPSMLEQLAATLEDNTSHKAGQNWQRIVEAENRHSVAGEPAAIEQLFPAILEAARARRGHSSLIDFLDPVAAQEGRAPWDQDNGPVEDEKALAGEVAMMLAEIERANDPRCTVNARTVETLENGEKVMETMTGYYRRVRGKWQEMKKLQQMGIV